MINVLYISHEWRDALGSTYSLVNMLHSVRETVYPTIILPHKGKVYDYLCSLGYTCYAIPFRLNIAPSSNLYLKYIPRKIWDFIINERAISKISQIITDKHIQLVHSNTSVLTIGYELARRNGLKHIWHLREFQDLDFKMTPFSGWKKLKNKINKSDAVISITKAIEKHFSMDNKANSYVLHDAVRSLKDICNVYPKKKYLLFCGNILPNKGAELALDIFIAFSDTYNDYKMLYVGNVTAEYQNHLQQKINNYNLQDKVYFIGYKNDVKPYMTKATALLMCSQNEAQGRVTVEAMFYGCPVIGYKAGGTQEIIEDGVNGYLFTSIEEAIAKLDMVINGDIQQIISNAQRFVKDGFSEEIYGVKLLSVYKSLL